VVDSEFGSELFGEFDDFDHGWLGVFPSIRAKSDAEVISCLNWR
jgi:hypothetical protein